MTIDNRLVFYIDAYSPDTIPMAKLAEYMADFALLLGREHAVHFSGLEPGSTKIAARVEREDVPKVRERLSDMHRGNLTRETAKIFELIDNRLANDNATGRVYAEEPSSPNAELLRFPGRERPKMQSYGPFNQDGTLDGILIAIGGKDETVHLRLQNGETVYANCDTNRTLARQLAKHLYEPIRIQGIGRWLRELDGRWSLQRFRVHRFDVLENKALSESVAALRVVAGSKWRDVDDPLRALDELRRDDEDELH